MGRPTNAERAARQAAEDAARGIKPAPIVHKNRSTNDDESLAAIYTGLNQTQLMLLFRIGERAVQRGLANARAAGVGPVKKVYNADVYAVADVAPYLCKPVFDPTEYIKSMDPRELPKILTKEYWAGMRSRQEYEERAGQLWRTEKVVQEVGELLKLVKMSTLLMLDAVERTTELSEKQRDIIKSLSHGMLKDLMGRVASNFKVPSEDEQLQEAVEDEEL